MGFIWKSIQILKQSKLKMQHERILKGKAKCTVPFLSKRSVFQHLIWHSTSFLTEGLPQLIGRRKKRRFCIFITSVQRLNIALCSPICVRLTTINAYSWRRRGAQEQLALASTGHAHQAAEPVMRRHTPQRRMGSHRCALCAGPAPMGNPG